MPVPGDLTPEGDSNIIHLSTPSVRAALEFQGRTLTHLEYRGQSVVLAAEFALALGYARGDALSQRLRGKWGEEFEEGRHFHKLEGEERRALSALTATETVSRAPVIHVLTEAGMDLVCIKTSKPLGQALRAFLVERGIVRAVLQGAPVAVAGVAATPASPSTSPAAMREQRLLDRERRLARLEDRKAAEFALRLVEGLDVDPVALAAFRLGLAKQVTGVDVSRMLPVEDERWFSASEAARVLRLSGAVFGRTRKAQGLVGEQSGLTRLVASKGAGRNNPLTVQLTQYTKLAIERVAERLGIVPDWSLA